MYKKSKWFTKYTDYSRWLRFPFRPTSRRYFPTFFKKQTGMDLSLNWKDPPINSITKSYVDKMVNFGFEPEQIIEDEYLLTGISIPLLIDRRQIGGFLAVYKPRKNRSFLKWVDIPTQSWSPQKRLSWRSQPHSEVSRTHLWLTTCQTTSN